MDNSNKKTEKTELLTLEYKISQEGYNSRDQLVRVLSGGGGRGMRNAEY